MTAPFEFLIIDYTNYEDDPSAVELRLVGITDLLEELDKAHSDDSIKIAVREAHGCILGWS